jgi:hypothetical protein
MTACGLPERPSKEWYSLPNSYPYMRMNQISIFLPKFHGGTLKIFDLIEERHHESGVDV